jgi:hypothetical protein
MTLRTHPVTLALTNWIKTIRKWSMHHQHLDIPTKSAREGRAIEAVVPVIRRSPMVKVLKGAIVLIIGKIVTRRILTSKEAPRRALKPIAVKLCHQRSKWKIQLNQINTETVDIPRNNSQGKQNHKRGFNQGISMLISKVHLTTTLAPDNQFIHQRMEVDLNLPQLLTSQRTATLFQRINTQRATHK